MPGLWAVQTESAGMLELPQSRHMKVQPALAGSVAQVGMTALLVSAVPTGMLGLLVSAVLVGMPASAARLAIRVVWAAQAVLPESRCWGNRRHYWLGWFFRVLEVELETAVTVGHNISLVVSKWPACAGRMMRCSV